MVGWGVLLGLWAPQAHGAPARHGQRNRYYTHSSVRLVKPKLEGNTVVLWWKAPSGKRMRYVPRGWHKGWLVHLRRAIQKELRYVAVGGHYFQTNGKGGVVQLTLVREVKRVFRGVRPVKFDGRMPIYLATVLPRNSRDRLKVYKLWGQVNLHQERFRNKLVCLYGDWFDFKGRSLGLVNQLQGVKGQALRSFSLQYGFPKKWHLLWRRRRRLLRYQKAWYRGQKPSLPIHYVPTLSSPQTRRHYDLCQNRLSPLEERTANPVDRMFPSSYALPAFWPLPLPSHLYRQWPRTSTPPTTLAGTKP